jgi:3-hydroxyacyl-[acyl-carrier-protein] dehydratase
MKRLEFEIRVAADHPALEGHFPGNPIVPGVVLLDAVIANVELATGCRISRVQQAKFHSVLRPSESAVAECFVNRVTVTFRALTRRGSDIVQVLSGSLALQSMQYDGR